jgi:hypothetical protein
VEFSYHLEERQRKLQGNSKILQQRALNVSQMNWTVLDNMNEQEFR